VRYKNGVIVFSVKWFQW